MYEAERETNQENSGGCIHIRPGIASIRVDVGQMTNQNENRCDTTIKDANVSLGDGDGGGEGSAVGNDLLLVLIHEKDDLHGDTTIGESSSAKLTVTRLCTQAPKAGARVFETGDEELLRLAHETKSLSHTTTPVL